MGTQCVGEKLVQWNWARQRKLPTTVGYAPWGTNPADTFHTLDLVTFRNTIMLDQKGPEALSQGWVEMTEQV